MTHGSNESKHEAELYQSTTEEIFPETDLGLRSRQASRYVLTSKPLTHAQGSTAAETRAEREISYRG